MTESNSVTPISAGGLRTVSSARLRKHADYQCVYQRSRKHFSASMTYFFADRVSNPPTGPRVGLTAGRVLGKAVERNRIKRRMREAVRLNLALLTRDVDVVLHPRRTVLTAEFGGLQSEVCRIFAVVEKAGEKAGERGGGRPDLKGTRKRKGGC
jgi:ribonuclease P protein component